MGKLLTTYLKNDSLVELHHQIGILFSKRIHTYLHLLHPSHRETYNTSEFEAEGLKIWVGNFEDFIVEYTRLKFHAQKFPHEEAEAKHNKQDRRYSDPKACNG